ncbi:MAG TPA: PglZ domain-containing protein, partial [Ardenticatenaceae bacterium]|nr:PglZ domain-containing protein [Ardenticatenaceae bacterium]
MAIKEFIQQHVILPRLQQASVLVVYDPDRRYRELCLELEAPSRRVVDASASSIESREAALAALQEMGRPGASPEGLLVYVPERAPLTDEDRQRDPFALYGACGAVFPDGDGDEYLSLCLRARPDHATEIRRIFNDNPSPSFAVIDAVGGGAGWPTLQALLRVESARDILLALLAPTEPQRKALQGDTAWATEARALFESTLGLRPITRARSWQPLADELWRFVLFSEFAFDLPAELPAALADVPRAGPEAEFLVRDLCDQLRSDLRTRTRYVERAETIEQELGLPTACRDVEDLGVLDTFPFEERTFFNQAVDALKRDRVDRLRQALSRHERSVWAGRGENQAQWTLLRAATELVQACADGRRQLPEHVRGQDALIDFYTGSLREADRLQREFEQAAGDCLDEAGAIGAVKSQARAAYRQLAEQVQNVFVRHLEKEGWPPAGRLANADVFDRLVAPRLQESGRRVALLLIDALRYELGVELHKQLARHGQVEVQPAFAQLPSVTPVGMASLLPGAGQGLKLVKKDDQLVPALGDQPLATVAHRMEVLRRRYGQRFAETTLAELSRGTVELPGTVELLVVRSNEMDSNFESNPEAAPGLITRTFQQIVAAIRRLREQGFQDAFVVTDHGFYLNTGTAAGDVGTKPPGNWVTAHDRLLLGDGSGDAANFVVPAERLGIRGDFRQAAGPRALVAYRAGQAYFHGGASLQETVVPVITVRLAAVEDRIGGRPAITLSYKRGSK